MNRTTLPRTVLRGGIATAAAAALTLAITWSASADTTPYNGYDVDGDGWFEAFGFDADGDRTEDTWTFDTDRDGAVDSVAVDQDGDGRPDAWGFDADSDGYVEEVALDTTGDALPDQWLTDSDADGAVDRLATDADGDGHADAVTATDPLAAPTALSVLLTEAGLWAHWTPTLPYGSGYRYDAEAAAQNEAGTLEHIGAAPEPAAGSGAPAEAGPDVIAPDVMVMAAGA